MAIRLAVLGATGNVGREMLNVLAEREFPASEVHAVASRRSLGVELSYGDRELKTRDVENFDWGAIDLCLMSAGAGVAREWAPKIAARGCIVIDNSSAFRMEKGVPLVAAEVNAHALDDIPKGIIANPNSATAQMVTVLKPLHDAAKIKRVVVSTYQSVSGAGREAMDELWTQTKGIFVNQAVEPRMFTKQIAFNVIPHIDDFMESGDPREEWKMKVETRKILDPEIEVAATCVRVPVFVGHSDSVNIEFENPITAADARGILRESPGLMVVDKREDEGYATPVECVGEWATYVSRIREDVTVDHGLALWIVSDNLRKGAALNAVQIAELLLNRGVLKA